ncbi:MAG: endonuclease/exonuclease/phosphatase family protein [Lacipirellulaceae bacterium]
MIWKAAHRSPHRHYDVWIYSDHGQEATAPYEQKYGRTIQEAIGRVVSEVQRVEFRLPTKALRHPGIDRSRWIGGGRIARAIFDREPPHGETTDELPVVVANGPIGLVYLSHSASEEEIRKLARAIVDGTGCPIVLTAKADGKAIAHRRSGEYLLPEQASSVLGEGHPFLREAAEDLVRLVHHPDSGDLVLSGWNPKGEPLSFALQHGAHGGPGAAETNAFVLAPPDTRLEAKGGNVLRPNDLRNAGLAHLCERNGFSISKATERSNTGFRPRFRMLTYNVHSCIGMDNRLSPARIARVIARSQADVVALQELDVVRKRTGHIDQAHEIARHLEMEFHFHPAWSLEEELYGDAILSRYPMRLVKADKLPNSLTGSHEPRGALWVEIMLGEDRIQIINTHLAVNSRIHAIQIEELAGQNWLESALERGPTILCGDFNFGPRSPHYKRLCKKLSDSQSVAGRPSPTWFSWKPMRRIDHIMISRKLYVTSAYVWADHLARQASDHLPLVVDLQLKAESFSADMNAPSEYVAPDSNAY